MSDPNQPVLSRRALLAGLTAVGLAGCSRLADDTTSPVPRNTAPGTATAPTATSAGTPAATPSATAAPPPYPGQGIEALRQERWGADGVITVIGELAGTAAFRRYEIHYPADGITIDGFMNVPSGAGPFPVVIVCHGYTPPESYELLTYTTEHADAFARAGYLVLHPSYRNHRGSGDGPNDYRIGYCRDVLHLMGLVQTLPQAGPGKVAVWGHSMGGGPVLRALAVAPERIAAAVAYGSVSADEAVNWNALVERRRAAGMPGDPEPKSPNDDPAFYAAISPGNYFTGLRVPVQIHHGGNDEQVHLSNAYELDAQLTQLGTPHELFVYPGQLHNLAGAAKEQLWTRCTDLFARTLH